MIRYGIYEKMKDYNYVLSTEQLHNLGKYAKAFKVSENIRQYMEVLL